MKKELKETVKKILTEYPATQNSDPVLIALVYNDLGWSYANTLFLTLKAIKEKRIPSMDSITRAARYVKQNNPELRGSEENQKRRIELMEDYRNEFKKSNLLC